MAQENTPDESAPQAPSLLSPRREDVVDGAAVTFQWEGGEGVSEYKLEVSANTEFDDLVVEQTTTGEELVVEDALPSDGSTFYWRVLASTEEGWKGGERIESFISTTPEEAATVDADERQRPEEDEDLGPPAELVGAAAEEVSAGVTGDEPARQRLAREQEIGVAEEGVESGQIFAIVAVISVAVLIIVFILFFWVDIVQRTARDAVVGVAGYPELRAAEVEATRKLDQYEAIDPEAGVYRIPIDRAMELVLEERGAAAEEAEPAEMVPTGSDDEALVQQDVNETQNE